MAGTPEEVFSHQPRRSARADLDEIVADYADDAVFISPAGVLRGKDGDVPGGVHQVAGRRAERGLGL